jgi:acetyl esterase/lipase
VDGAAGPLPARLYNPAPAKFAEPIILYFHGGGFVEGGLDSYDISARALASQAHAKVLSVAYRLAPEFRFPAAHDDAFAAYRWLLANAASLGADPRRIAVAGEDAGANLAINVSMAARDAHIKPPVQEVLIDPIAGTDFQTPSYIADEYAAPLSRVDMRWYFNNEIAKDADLADPRLNLIGKADLHHLPPTTVISAEIDPLESDGRFLTGELQDQGDTVDRTEYGGMTHDFFAMGPVVGRANDAEGFAAQALDATFDTIGDPPAPAKPRPVVRRRK